MDGEQSKLVLPLRPPELAGRPVAGWAQDISIDTYEVGKPDAYPEFLSARVYQGSSGAVFPMPFFESIEKAKKPKTWQGLHLENEYVRLMILPELGGRIHVGQDLTNGYDFFYRNNVIKPALVGLAGPWISGGVEFNWPQHHRPATFLPTDYAIEQEPDGACTIWCSDHDPLKRMKGMHGVRLRPKSSVIELRVRVFNRTEDVQTFLWWSNVAAKVGDNYQSFFPPDVTIVADHAKRACATFPRVSGRYYGVDYPARVDPAHPDADRLDWYANIPVPTSYMIAHTTGDFFGGYDHGLKAGFVYWADHRFAPGKKQWTWGNAPFGWAWDRQLTDDDGPYVELMAGAFTDNQPDFSYLMPGETKAFSQFWYPISLIGPAQAATLDAAVSLRREDGQVSVGVALPRVRRAVVTQVIGDAQSVVWAKTADLGPGRPLVATFPSPGPGPLTVSVTDGDQLLVQYSLPAGDPLPPDEELPVLATAIPLPEMIDSVEELSLSARHLEQYRHATRSPEPYLLEALRRDPGHTPSLLQLAARRYRQGLYAECADLAGRAIDRLTARNPNPPSGEAHYRLGLALSRLGRTTHADDALMKAAWDEAWRASALAIVAAHCLARGEAEQALRHLGAALAVQADDTRLMDMLAWASLQLPDGPTRCARIVADTLRLDPLDWWARDLGGADLTTDPQTLLDVAGEYAQIGAWQNAASLAALAADKAPEANAGMVGALPLAYWYQAWALAKAGDDTGAAAVMAQAATCEPGTCQLSRLDDVDIATWVASHPYGLTDPNAELLLGNWCYHVRRHEDAIAHWQASVAVAPTAIAWRNLGVAAYNTRHDAAGAKDCYARARALRPDDAKLLYESDQLAAKLGFAVAGRLKTLRARPDLVAQRDDLTVVAAELATLEGDPGYALDLLSTRGFAPWEGGEGQTLAAWEHAQMVLARQHPEDAVTHLRAALEPPDNLGEARHLLANASDIWLALGDALEVAGDRDAARQQWLRAARFRGDFQQMAVMPYSDLSYYSILAMRRLGEDSRVFVDGLAAYADGLARTKPEIDYFATSLPTMLLFDDDLDETQERTVLLLRAQVAKLRGNDNEAGHLIGELMRRDPANPKAALWSR